MNSSRGGSAGLNPGGLLLIALLLLSRASSSQRLSVPLEIDGSLQAIEWEAEMPTVEAARNFVASRNIKAVAGCDHACIVKQLVSLMDAKALARRTQQCNTIVVDHTSLNFVSILNGRRIDLSFNSSAPVHQEAERVIRATHPALLQGSECHGSVGGQLHQQQQEQEQGGQGGWCSGSSVVQSTAVYLDMVANRAANLHNFVASQLQAQTPKGGFPAVITVAQRGAMSVGWVANQKASLDRFKKNRAPPPPPAGGSSAHVEAHGDDDGRRRHRHQLHGLPSITPAAATITANNNRRGYRGGSAFLAFAVDAKVCRDLKKRELSSASSFSSSASSSSSFNDHKHPSQSKGNKEEEEEEEASWCLDCSTTLFGNFGGDYVLFRLHLLRTVLVAGFPAVILAAQETVWHAPPSTLLVAQLKGQKTTPTKTTTMGRSSSSPTSRSPQAQQVLSPFAIFAAAAAEEEEEETNRSSGKPRTFATLAPFVVLIESPHESLLVLLGMDGGADDDGSAQEEKAAATATASAGATAATASVGATAAVTTSVSTTTATTSCGQASAHAALQIALDTYRAGRLIAATYQAHPLTFNT